MKEMETTAVASPCPREESVLVPAVDEHGHLSKVMLLGEK